MVFNSFDFILIFLPVCAAVFALVSKLLGRRAAAAWLIAASIFFYARHQPELLALLAFSVFFGQNRDRPRFMVVV